MISVFLRAPPCLAKALCGALTISAGCIAKRETDAALLLRCAATSRLLRIASTTANAHAPYRRSRNGGSVSKHKPLWRRGAASRHCRYHLRAALRTCAPSNQQHNGRSKRRWRWHQVIASPRTVSAAPARGAYKTIFIINNSAIISQTLRRCERRHCTGARRLCKQTFFSLPFSSDGTEGAHTVLYLYPLLACCLLVSNIRCPPENVL